MLSPEELKVSCGGTEAARGDCSKNTHREADMGRSLWESWVWAWGMTFLGTGREESTESRIFIA